jgi:hypothetical protein
MGLSRNTAAGGVLRSGTVVTASGTAVNFTDIPSWVKRVTVMFSGVSTSGSSIPLIQLGDSGGIETTSYSAVGQAIGVASVNQTTGFGLTGSIGAASILQGTAVLSLVDSSTNRWSMTSNLAYSDGNTVAIGAGSKALSATLDRIRITTVNGTDTFDAGTINILYE